MNFATRLAEVNLNSKSHRHLKGGLKRLLSDSQIDQVHVLSLVIARCAPYTKFRMIDALHHRKAFAAMTGDVGQDANIECRSRCSIGTEVHWRKGTSDSWAIWMVFESVSSLKAWSIYKSSVIFTPPCGILTFVANLLFRSDLFRHLP